MASAAAIPESTNGSTAAFGATSSTSAAASWNSIAFFSRPARTTSGHCRVRPVIMNDLRSELLGAALLTRLVTGHGEAVIYNIAHHRLSGRTTQLIDRVVDHARIVTCPSGNRGYELADMV
jgi:hypothetical protein